MSDFGFESESEPEISAKKPSISERLEALHTSDTPGADLLAMVKETAQAVERVAITVAEASARTLVREVEDYLRKF